MKKTLTGYLGNKGVTLITLIIAITIFSVFITVFSYVMIAKHGSEVLYVQSTQAYAIAQAGIEYSIQYARDNGYEDEDAFPIVDEQRQPLIRSLGSGSGSGSFTIVCLPLDPAEPPNTWTSTGTVGIAEREIILQYPLYWAGYSGGLGQPLSLDPSDLPYTSP